MGVLPAHEILVRRDIAYQLTLVSTADLNPIEVVRFSDYVKLGKGSELPARIENARVVPTDRNHTMFEYRYYLQRMTTVGTEVDRKEFQRFLPKPGYTIRDMRFDVPLRYPYRKDMSEEELRKLLESRRAEAGEE